MSRISKEEMRIREAKKMINERNANLISAFLNSQFYESPLTFEVSDQILLPTINIRLKSQEYVREDQFILKDGFPERIKNTLIKQLGIDVTFNNTGRTFWWSWDEQNKRI
jgi:hypothetical protein